MVIRYEAWIVRNYNLNEIERRNIKGIFRNKTTGKIIKGDNFSAVVVSDSAEETYRAAIKYYNETRHTPEDAEREYVFAYWENDKNSRVEFIVEALTNEKNITVEFLANLLKDEKHE